MLEARVSGALQYAVLAQDVEEALELGDSTAPDRLDRPEGTTYFDDAVVAEALSGAGVENHHTHAVRHYVVQLARYAKALVANHLAPFTLQAFPVCAQHARFTLAATQHDPGGDRDPGR